MHWHASGDQQVRPSPNPLDVTLAPASGPHVEMATRAMPLPVTGKVPVRTPTGCQSLKVEPARNGGVRVASNLNASGAMHSASGARAASELEGHFVGSSSNRLATSRIDPRISASKTRLGSPQMKVRRDSDRPNFNLNGDQPGLQVNLHRRHDFNEAPASWKRLASRMSTSARDGSGLTVNPGLQVASAGTPSRLFTAVFLTDAERIVLASCLGRTASASESESISPTNSANAGITRVVNSKAVVWIALLAITMTVRHR